MLCRTCVCVAVMLMALGVSAVRAGDDGPVIVIPSRPGVPVVINGIDASYAVVEGDWGLSRPGAVPVTVIGGSPILPNPVYERRNSYHPRYGRAPLRGRVEIEPPPGRRLPPRAESFSRSWSTSSDVAPATIVDPETYPQNGPEDSQDPAESERELSKRPPMIHSRRWRHTHHR